MPAGALRQRGREGGGPRTAGPSSTIPRFRSSPLLRRVLVQKTENVIDPPPNADAALSHNFPAALRGLRGTSLPARHRCLVRAFLALWRLGRIERLVIANLLSGLARGESGQPNHFGDAQARGLTFPRLQPCAARMSSATRCRIRPWLNLDSDETAGCLAPCAQQQAERCMR